MPTTFQPARFRALTIRDLDDLLDRGGVSDEVRMHTRAVAQVLPFRTNEFVVNHLIDWSAVPDDPIFRLVFPQPEMLLPEELSDVTSLLRADAPKVEMAALVGRIRGSMNAHPAGQMDQNSISWQGQPIPGVQHKYRETLLYFPRRGQTCHAYCTYCFRWAQFVGDPELKMASTADGTELLLDYLRAHHEISDVLITGGDPLIMNTDNLREILAPLLAPGMEHIRSIRLGTKALTYWPYRFTTDGDSDDLLRLFEECRAAGKHVAIMAHVTHPVELEPDPVRHAVRRVLDAGAVVRTQAPLVRTINDSADDWRSMWQTSVSLGAVPYYMFVERDTGPRHYFEVPLVRAWQIYRDAVSTLSGLARTVRGPSMSADQGKVTIDGVTEVAGRPAIALRYLQARDPQRVGRPFFAKYDESATWVSDLQPLFASDEAYLDQLPHD